MRLISKFMALQHLLSNISRSKGNQTMKFSQLVEYNMQLFLWKNHTQNMVEKLFTDPFLKTQHWAYLWINSLKLYTVNFQCMPSWGLSKYIENKLPITCFLLIFEKQKEVWNYSRCLIFCMIFEEKYFCCCILLTDQISLPVRLYLLRY